MNSLSFPRASVNEVMAEVEERADDEMLRRDDKYLDWLMAQVEPSELAVLLAYAIDWSASGEAQSKRIASQMQNAYIQYRQATLDADERRGIEDDLCGDESYANVEGAETPEGTT